MYGDMRYAASSLTAVHVHSGISIVCMAVSNFLLLLLHMRIILNDISIMRNRANLVLCHSIEPKLLDMAVQECQGK